MRTAEDFDKFYATPDPWKINHAWFRDAAIRRAISKYIAGQRVLELGCGEGHLTRTVFSSAKSVTGIDVSDVAISRAKAAAASNAEYGVADFLTVPLSGYDVIAAIECLYYLTPADQETFFAKIAEQHRGLLILSGPIIGENQYRSYFTHDNLTETFRRHGYSIVRFHNLNLRRGYFLKALSRLWIGLPDLMPTDMVYQRCYIIRII